jgi:hypothetical protein
MIAEGALDSQHARDEALRGAAASAHPELVAEILKYRPDVNARADDGATALLRIEDHPMRLMLGKDPSADRPVVISMLLTAGADPNLQNKDGNTALHRAADATEARALLKGGARLDVRNKRGETPLLSAEKEDVALALIEAGANTDPRTPDGQQLAKLARSNGWSKVLAHISTSR